MAIPKLALIPSGVKAGKLYSVLPTNGDGDFTTTRNTVATRVNENGLIEEVASNVPRLDYSDGGCPSLLLEPERLQKIQYSEAFDNAYWGKSSSSVQGDPSTAGAEEVTNGDFATDTDWTKGAGTTISSGLLNHTGGPTDTEQIISISEKLYKIEYTIVSGSGSVRFWSNIGSYTNTQTGVGTYVSYFYYDSSIGTDGRFAMNLTNDISIDNVSIKEVQGFVSPSGDTSAFKLVEDTANTTHQIQRSFSFLNQKYSLSAFLKADERNWIKVNLYDGSSSAYAYFDLTNGVVGQELGASGKIEDYGNGWYKCSMSTSLNVSSGNGNIGFRLAEFDGGTGYTGNGTSGLYIYGAQLEQGSFPTSYIPNYGTAAGVTRSADTANGAGNASTFNDSEGVLMAEISALVNDSSLREIALSDGSSSNRIELRYGAESNRIQFVARSGGVVQASISNESNNIILNNKVVIKYKLNDFALWVNGFELGIDDSGSTPIGLSELAFDDGSGANDFYGNTKQIQYFDSALNDSDLEKLTSWTSFTAMANALNYTII